MNSDPQPHCQLEGCPFTIVECLYCKEGIGRDEIAGHQLEHCLQRPYICEYCAEYKSTFKDVTHSYWPECKAFLSPCPNMCSILSGSRICIQRQHLDQHVKEECPKTVVKCELHHAGCEVMLPRKDMASHLNKDSIHHISLLAAENHRLSQQLVEKEKQICLLTRQNAELEEKTTNHLQDVTSQLLELKQELAQKFTSQSHELTETKRDLIQLLTSQSHLTQDRCVLILGCIASGKTTIANHLVGSDQLLHDPPFGVPSPYTGRSATKKPNTT